ncbi:hypothetical protein EYF80_009021 [Liparis tanakae]|uniref:Uncharacterized protein n=1 Tax=Liparis tanakae TaxID=230148 RepID=A0A4Z2ISP8_9TELE|nr:hypothetical protein EYF80_009021 [Liparis tanakae]
MDLCTAAPSTSCGQHGSLKVTKQRKNQYHVTRPLKQTTAQRGCQPLLDARETEREQMMMMMMMGVSSAYGTQLMKCHSCREASWLDTFLSGALFTLLELR